MTIMIAVTGSQVGMGLWPSLDTASSIADKANVALIGSLVVGVVSTVLIVWMGNVKESHWELDRTASAERIAQLNNETARLRAKEPLVDEALMATAQAGRMNALAAQQNIVTSELFALSQGLTTRDAMSEPARAFLIVSEVEPFAGTKFSAATTSTDIGLETLLRSLRFALKRAGWEEVDPVGTTDQARATGSSTGFVKILAMLAKMPSF